MRKEEEISAEIFKKHLQKEYADVNYRSGDDPPDIVFEIDGYKLAVEHTRLFEYIDKEGKGLSRIGVDKQIMNLEEKLNNRLNENLNSSWIISIDTPIKKNELKIIEDRILEMIHKNLDKSSFKHSYGKIYLQKTDQLNNQITIISIPSPSSRIPLSDRLTCDIQGQIDFAIQKILNDKCAKMRKLKNYDKRILLVDNHYMFTTKENVNKSLRKFKSIIKVIDEIWILSRREIYRVY